MRCSLDFETPNRGQGFLSLLSAILSPTPAQQFGTGPAGA